jgi:hypothetical protein
MTYLECPTCDGVDVEEEYGSYSGGPCFNPECSGTLREMED